MDVILIVEYALIHLLARLTLSFAAYRHGNTDFYGKGKTVDTSRKFTVVTQFHGSGSTLERLSQYFIQDGNKIPVPESQYVSGGSEIDAAFCDAAKDAFGDSQKFQEMGGLPQMGDATGKGMVLVMSVWDDVRFIVLLGLKVLLLNYYKGICQHVVA